MLLKEPSSAERLAATRKQVAALHAEQAELADRITQALVAGDDTAQLNLRRVKIAARLEDLALLQRELERRSVEDERRQLLNDVQAAFAQRGELAAQVSAKSDEVCEKEQAYYSALGELQSLQRTSDGSFTALQRLEKHRDLHPDISEESKSE
jgi:hypothetical protein